MTEIIRNIVGLDADPPNSRSEFKAFDLALHPSLIEVSRKFVFIVSNHQKYRRKGR